MSNDMKVFLFPGILTAVAAALAILMLLGIIGCHSHHDEDKPIHVRFPQAFEKTPEPPLNRGDDDNDNDNDDKKFEETPRPSFKTQEFLEKSSHVKEEHTSL